MPREMNAGDPQWREGDVIFCWVEENYRARDPVLGALIYLTVRRSLFEDIFDEMYDAAMLLLRTRDLADRFLVDAGLQPVSGEGHVGCVHVP